MSDVLITTGIDSASYRRGLRDMESSASQSGGRIRRALESSLGGGIGKGLVGGIIGGSAIAAGLRLATDAMQEFAKTNREAQRDFEAWGKVKSSVLSEIGDGLHSLIGGPGGGGVSTYQKVLDYAQDEVRRTKHWLGIKPMLPGDSAADVRKARETEAAQNAAGANLERDALIKRRLDAERKLNDDAFGLVEQRLQREKRAHELFDDERKARVISAAASFDDEYAAIRRDKGIDEETRKRRLASVFSFQTHAMKAAGDAFDRQQSEAIAREIAAASDRAASETESDRAHAASLGDRLGGLRSGLSRDLLTAPGRVVDAGTAAQVGSFAVGDKAWQQDIRKTREEIEKTQSEQNTILRKIEKSIASWAGVAIAG